MATLPLKKCSAPGCCNLTREGSKCEKHRSNKGTSKNRSGDPFYSITAWKRIRDARRIANPLCQECEKRGKVKAMHAVDHIKPRRDWPELELDYENTQSLCEHCHNSWKQSEEKRARVSR